MKRIELTSGDPGRNEDQVIKKYRTNEILYSVIKKKSN